MSSWKNEEYGKQVAIISLYNHWYFIKKKTMFLFIMRSGFISF